MTIYRQFEAQAVSYASGAHRCQEIDIRYDPSKCVWRTIPNYLVVVDISGAVTEIEGQGGQIWALLINGASVGEVVRELSQAYLLTEGEIEADVERFIAEMCQRQLLVEREE